MSVVDKRLCTTCGQTFEDMKTSQENDATKVTMPTTRIQYSGCAGFYNITFSHIYTSFT